MIVERGNALRSTKADISAFKQSNLLKFDCFFYIIAMVVVKFSLKICYQIEDLVLK